jgi:SAM-dependent methyltransferase
MAQRISDPASSHRAHENLGAPDSPHRRAQRIWDNRVAAWHDHVSTSPGMLKVLQATLEACGDTTALDVVDLGCGSGSLSIPLAASARSVLSVDISPAMLEALAQREPPPSLRTLCADLATLRLPEPSADLVVSIYALHHLSDDEKASLVERAFSWLRPGGRLIISDMMFGRGLSPRDRQIILSKVRLLASKGPGGLWRIAKNAVRFSTRLGSERPCPPEVWARMLESAGFQDVRFTPIVAEAVLLEGRRR